MIADKNPVPLSPVPFLKILIIVFTVSIIFFISKSLFDNNRTLMISDSVSGQVYGKWHLKENDEFAIEFIHSVNNSPVREIFVIEGRKIRIDSVRFYSFGAGILTDLGENLHYFRNGDAMVISGYDTLLKELNCIVGTVSDHLLFIGDDAISLRELCGRNAHIVISVK